MWLLTITYTGERVREGGGREGDGEGGGRGGERERERIYTLIVVS